MLPWIYNNLVFLAPISPMLGVIFLLLLPRRHEDASKEIAVASSLFTLVLTLILLGIFSSGLSFTREWIPSLGISFSLGLASFNALLLPLISLVVLVSVYLSWGSVKEKRREFFGILLFVEAAFLIFFSSKDIFLSYVSLELAVVGICFLRIFYSKEEKLVTFMGLSSVLIAIVVIFLIMGAQSAAFPSIDSLSLEKGPSLILFILFLIGISIRLGIFPFHSWREDDGLPAIRLVTQLIPAAAIYFLYRLIPPFTAELLALRPYLSWIIAASILISAIIASTKKDLGKIIKYVLMVHFSFALLGIISVTREGFAGFGYEVAAILISITIFFFITSFLRSLKRDDLKGLIYSDPLLGSSLFITLLAFAGVPALIHFPGFFMIWMGLFKASWLLALVVIASTVILTVSILKVVGYVLIFEDEPKGKKFNRIDLIAVLPVIVFIFGFGIFPDYILNFVKSSTESLWGILWK